MGSKDPSGGGVPGTGGGEPPTDKLGIWAEGIKCTEGPAHAKENCLVGTELRNNGGGWLVYWHQFYRRLL
jgi:hypothetical protein